MNWLKRILTPPLIVLAALLMWIEEYLWEHLKVLTAWIAKLPLIRWFEVFVARLPPYLTMFVLLLPGAVLLPFKIGALWLMAHGQFLLGTGTIIAAKIVGTAVVARLYVVCKPKLMTIAWFAKLHDWLIATRNYLYDCIKAMPLYQVTRAKFSVWKHKVKSFFRSIRGHRGISFRWRAIRRLFRHRRAVRKKFHETKEMIFDAAKPTDS